MMMSGKNSDYKEFKDILQKIYSQPVISNVEIVKESNEMKLVREIMEEDNHDYIIEFNVTMPNPIQYLKFNYIIKP